MRRFLARPPGASETRTEFLLTSHDGSDFAAAPQQERPLLTDRAREALECEWLSFEEVLWGRGPLS